jgi:hypothetical protein
MTLTWLSFRLKTTPWARERMKNTKLAELNFRTLLHYSRVPEFGARSSFPTIACTGFCVSCEKNGFLDGGNQRLNLMSHGADTDDFEKSICELPPGGLEVSIVFLLASPGAHHDLVGDPFNYEGVTKRPPVKHYYWTTPQPPQKTTWPTDQSKLENSYGDYFAYLIKTHELHNAYFTNIIKCNLTERDDEAFISYKPTRDPDNRHSKILNNCYNLFLSEEMRVINPQIVFYFGRNAEKMGDQAGLRSLLRNTNFRRLYHPAARCGLRKTVSLNDERILDELRKRAQA